MADLNKLTLADLKLGMKDLLTTRREVLLSTKSGNLYVDLFTQQRSDLEGLPEVLTGGKPLADQLGETDKDHDGFGAAIWSFTDAYLRHPGYPPEVREAALRIRKAFIPKKSELKDGYADEASRAVDRQPKLEECRADMERFPVIPTTEDEAPMTLYQWASDFLDWGQKLDTLLTSRADVTEADRSMAAPLRSSMIGVIGRMRAALVDECKTAAELPQDIDHRIFGYFDQLAGMRAAGGSAPTPRAPTDPS